jgi:hypothetical protein
MATSVDKSEVLVQLAAERAYCPPNMQMQRTRRPPGAGELVTDSATLSNGWLQAIRKSWGWGRDKTDRVWPSSCFVGVSFSQELDV